MFSPTKLILILVAIGIVFFALRFYRTTIAPSLGKDKKQGEFSRKKSDKMLDLEECPKCGSFVADLEDHRCKD
jgi:ribosomal protein S27AE